jgi:WD40 repeat protein
MRIWNLKNKRTEMKFNQHSHLLSMGILLKDQLFTHGREGKVLVWDLNKMEIIQELRITENEDTQYSFCKCTSDHDILCTPSSQDSSQVSSFLLLSVRFMFSINTSVFSPFNQRIRNMEC